VKANRSRWRQLVVAALPWLELLALAAAAPFLLFPTARPWWTAGTLLVFVLCVLLRLIVRREPWPVTPFNAALLLLALMIPVAVWASALPDLTLPKLTGLILGLAAFRAMAFFVRDRRTLWWGVAAFALIGLGMWAVGFLSTEWSTKFPWLDPVLRHLPRTLTVLPKSLDSGVNANILAGTLMLYLPVAVALTAGWWHEHRLGLVLLSVIAAGIAGMTVILTQSRSGWMGSAAGIIGLMVCAGWITGRRRMKILTAVLPLIFIAATIALIVARPDIMVRFVNTSGQTAGEISFSGRPEIWSRALYAIQDFPFTGVGLGSFDRVVSLLYPLFTISPDTEVGHAHNVFLQVAVDVGLPGLIAYLSCLWIAFAVAWNTAKHSSGALRSLALGLLAGLVALHVYGLTDTTWSAKPSVAFWLALGLIAALPNAGAIEWRGD